MALRIPRINTPITRRSDDGRTEAQEIEPIWFRFFDQLSNGGDPTISTTVGDQTINAYSGRFEVAAAATSVTITNNLVNSLSIVVCIVARNDATAIVKNVVVSPGSFVVNLIAPTAQTTVAFYVVA